MRRAEIKLNIGIDFDNTIADYDLVFEEVAIDMGFLENKNELKKLWNGIPREFLNCDDLNSKGF